jgi:hypothetical protein
VTAGKVARLRARARQLLDDGGGGGGRVSSYGRAASDPGCDAASTTRAGAGGAARGAARGGLRERQEAAEARRRDFEAARLRSEVRGRVEGALLGPPAGGERGSGGGLGALAAAVVRHGEVSGACLAEVVPGLLDVLARGLDARAVAVNRDGDSDRHEDAQSGDDSAAAGGGADERLACAVALGSLAWRAPAREAMAALAVPRPAGGLPRRTLAQVLADAIRAEHAAAGEGTGDEGGWDLARACAAVAAQLCESECGWRACRATGLSPWDPAVAAHPVLAAVLKGTAAPQLAAVAVPAEMGGSDRAVLAGPSTSLGAEAAREGYAERRRWRPHKARQAGPGGSLHAK